ncbi:hypothetical protein R5W24_003358 [Gemmata sp. JC717]|uniref:hypothetical protein n=1 Tax=Gemmata algarum TaxID=2975278 RepID=UPI0021BAD0EB|nr:hypothetical protein [Gemmata algarum]MDY3554239.1 hypothetical protein [Gemmata algarum]
MPLTVKFCASDPQDRFRPVIQEAVDRGTDIDVAVAFMTKAGVDLFTRWVRALDPARCRLCVSVQFPTNIDALRDLSGLLGDRLFIHLGSKKPEEIAVGKSTLSPLLHSKIIWIAHGQETVSIFVGSHNWTSKALDGANFEASTLLVCEPNEQFSQDVKAHLDACVHASEVFNPADIDFYKSIQSALFSDGPQPIRREIIEEFTPAEAVVIHAEDHRADATQGTLQLYLPLKRAMPLRWFEPIGKTVYLYLYPPGTLLGHPTPTSDPHFYEGTVRAVSGDVDDPITGRAVNAQIPDLTRPQLMVVGGNIPALMPGIVAQVVANLRAHGTVSLPVFVADRSRPGVRIEPRYDETTETPRSEDRVPLPRDLGRYYADGSIKDGRFVFQTPLPVRTTTVSIPGINLYRIPPARTVQEIILRRQRQSLRHADDESSRRREADVVVLTEATDDRFEYVYLVYHVLGSVHGTHQ